SLPGHDRAGRALRPRRHPRQLPRDRHPGRLRTGAERLARLMAALFPSSVVGSLPRPAEVLSIIEKSSPGEADKRALDAAIREAIAMQEQAGLDVVTDGEWRRRSYIGVIAELAHGFALETNLADGRPWTVVTEKLAPKEPGFIAAEAAFLKKFSTVETKITLPAPALLGERLWHPVRSRAAYPKRDDFVRDCVEPLRREIALIRDIGVDIV